MNPLSISTLIQNQVGIEVMMHFACRDRNLLAVQADLLDGVADGSVIVAPATDHAPVSSSLPHAAPFGLLLTLS